MIDCDDTNVRKTDACDAKPVSPSTESVYFKPPLNDATLDALHKLVERGGVAGQAAQEMLDAELLGADAQYAARLRGKPDPEPEAETVSWWFRCREQASSWFKKK
ncbi:hypothetical protein FXN63_08305 [Pigmentiphaga aceris]|uniref:Uncharacterized protein n=1 Tax=Pigmentiphaga aceris TaxID=1940612 RepID=A0A5C0AZ35_9BURK|nr:hypothetical protein [Pigmentiphaga aceris]QEI05851.1 hypothetical protein FXN63_08305 [Pigmentiphaga aceris]